MIPAPAGLPTHARRPGRRLALVAGASLLCTSLTGCFSAPPQVVALEPNNGSNNIVADAQVRVRFDRPVTAASLQPRFHIDPAIRHCELRAAWTAPAGAACRLRVLEGGALLELDHPGAPFLSDTKYTLRLDGGFRDPQGISNSLDHRWELTTGAPPRVGSFTPSNGAGDVPADTSLVITFNAYMKTDTVQQAVQLQPAVPGTRVYRNGQDHGRFVVLPGRLLTPGTTYTLSVNPSATEEHGLTMAARAAARFSVAGLGRDGHALVLAAPVAGASADQVLLTGLGPRTPGDPVAAASVYQAPACQAAECGAVHLGEPAVSVVEAAISPDGLRLALVLADRERPGATSLVVQPTSGGPGEVLAGGARHVSWSPDSTRLAYAAGAEIHVVSAANGADLSLPAGPPLSAPAIWQPGSSRLVLPVGTSEDPGTTRGVDLADASLGVRYPLPALTGRLSAPALSPSGSRLAVRRDGDPATAGLWAMSLAGDAAPPARLAADLTPVSWVGEGALVATTAAPSPTPLVRFNVASGDRTAIAGMAAGDLPSLVASASGRQLAYLHADAAGVTQAFVANADGSNPTPLTTFLPGDRMGVAVSISG